MRQKNIFSVGETTTTNGIISTKYKERHCTHSHSISGLQRWCDKGVFPPDCATCTQGDWEEYWVVTSTSTNKIALLNSQELSKEQKEKLENIFPELEESEDERIRKELIQLISCMHDADHRKKDWLAWLEKQGEKVTNINGEDYGIDGLYHAIRILKKTVGRVTGYQSDDGILEHRAAINAVKELYEKQGEKKGD